MSEWRQATLDQLVRLQRGHDLPTAQRRPGNVPVLGSAGQSGVHDTSLVKGPGVVVGRAGSSMGTATYSDVDFWPLNTSLYVTDFLGNHPRFTFYLLSYMDFSGYNSGAAQPMLNRNYIKGISVQIPPPGEQQAIANALGALDDKILANEQLSSTHELLLQCKFNQLGLSEEPDPAAGIPVTDLITFNPQTERPTSEKPIYVDMAALSTSRASITSWTRRAPKSGTRFRNGDTLFARITPCLENGKTGYVDFMESGEIGLGSTEFIVMRTTADAPSELAYFLARDARFCEHAMRNMIGSSGRQRVSAVDASNYIVNAPDSDRLSTFGEEAAQAFAHWRSLEIENRTLAELRDTLLPQLVTGKIRVKDAERIVEDAT
ncbi:restriction endonuclease subunit S [Streptomyces sp. NPDC088116]|uniref:restriction endonuclease subunit S n=1 Tax=Streptomyces sp. NPDC088116 TaxID=3365825 RepID=UPI00382E3B94